MISPRAVRSAKSLRAMQLNLQASPVVERLLSKWLQFGCSRSSLARRLALDPANNSRQALSESRPPIRQHRQAPCASAADPLAPESRISRLLRPRGSTGGVQVSCHPRHWPEDAQREDHTVAARLFNPLLLLLARLTDRFLHPAKTVFRPGESCVFTKTYSMTALLVDV